MNVARERTADLPADEPLDPRDEILEQTTYSSAVSSWHGPLRRCHPGQSVPDAGSVIKRNEVARPPTQQPPGGGEGHRDEGPRHYQSATESWWRQGDRTCTATITAESGASSTWA